MACVAVVGPGAMGCMAAAAVYRTGRHDLMLCGRRAQPAPIQVEQRSAATTIIPLPILSDPATCPAPVDVVLLAVKAHQIDGARDWLAALCGPQTIVGVLQNGVEQRERVSPLVGGAVVLPLVVYCRAEVIAPGRILADNALRLIAPREPAAEVLAGLLAGSGASVELVDDFLTQQWRKLCWNAVTGIMAAAACPARMFRDPAARRVARALAQEAIHVARAQGADIEDSFADELVQRLDAMAPEAGASILSDRLAGRPLEWEARNGVIRRLGARCGVATPVSDVLVPILAAAGGS
jgi:2-dehydropantoate 2-reductase